MMKQDFELLQRLLHERSGLALNADKTYLLETRLLPIARRRGMRDLADLVAALRRAPDPILIAEIIEAMTTNETFFFRDIHPFEQFRRSVLPAVLAARHGASDKVLRIWCAACSSGQEPYSLAMICREEQARLAGWKVEILATDLSHDILARAREGIYSQFEVQRGLPAPLLVKYFEQSGQQWRIRPELRDAVQFRACNLLEDTRRLGRFDIVFCRNVLIYFDEASKRTVLDRIAGQLTPDGALFLGAAETVCGLTPKFLPVAQQRGVYRLAAQGAGGAPAPAKAFPRAA